MAKRTHFPLILACLLGLSLLLPVQIGAQQGSKAPSVKVAQQQGSKAPSVNIAQQPEETQTPSEASEAEESPEARARAEQEARQAKAKKESEAILVEKGGVLLPMGTLTLEPAFNYTHFSGNRIVISGFTLFQAIVIGTIEVEQVKRDILTGYLTARYGLLDRLQLEVKVPWLWRRDQLVVPTQSAGAPQRPVVTEGNGWGDAEGALLLHALRGRGWLPDVILNLRGKTRTGTDPYGIPTKDGGQGKQVPKYLPTGTGHCGLSGGITLVKASDPVVFFGTFNYYWNMERDVSQTIGEVDPGDSYEYILGMAVALNEKVSLSLSFQDNLVSSTKQNGVKIPGSNLNAASLFLGASYRFTRNVSVYLNAGVGLTEDSSDYQLQLNVPFTISLF